MSNTKNVAKFDIPITISVSRLMEVLSVQTASYQCERMSAYLHHVLKGAEFKVEEDSYGNIYVTKGKSDIYPAIVSHTDTVHDIYKHFAVHQDNDYLFAYSKDTNNQVGIGGDDKVGVFMCLTMIFELPVVKVAFFKDEEVGCIGSGKANMQFFEDCGFVLQCDRRNSDDFIFDAGRELYGANFEKAVAPYLTKNGYSETYGMMTDVQELKRRGLKVACANMSCGYYFPHSANEIVSISAVQKCYNLVKDIMTNLGSQSFPHEEKHSKTRIYNTQSSHNDFNWDNFFGPRTNQSVITDDLDNFEYEPSQEVNEEEFLQGWGLTVEENNHYKDHDTCMKCESILDEDIDGLKKCECCGEFRHIPQMYFLITR